MFKYAQHGSYSMVHEDEFFDAIDTPKKLNEEGDQN